MRNYWWLVVFLNCQAVFCIHDSKLQNLKKGLETSIFDVWSLRQNFSDYDTLRLSEKFLSLGVGNDGATTQGALHKVYEKVLRGENITMTIFGGSCTQGADLGCDSNVCTYHFALLSWWNSVITPATGSHLKRVVLAIGGTGSTYTGHCWKEYLLKDEVVDIVLWEFYINDPDSLEYKKGVEKFVRSVMLYPSRPALIFVKFFTEALFPNPQGKIHIDSRTQKKLKVITELSKYYAFTTVNILAPVAAQIGELTAEKSVTFSDMFVSSHPSHLAHGLMGYVVISHLRRRFSFHLKRTMDKCDGIVCPHDDKPDAVVDPPTALTSTSDRNDTVCWSAVMPDDRFLMPHNLFTLPVLGNHMFSKQQRTKWEVAHARRRDIRGGWFAHYPDSYLLLEMEIPGPIERQLYLAISHIPDGNLTTFTVKHATKESVVSVDCSRTSILKSMVIHPVGKFPPGKVNLQIYTLNGGCELSSIIIE